MNEKTSELELDIWTEYRLIFSDASVSRDWVNGNYVFIREILIPLVNRLGIKNFHILNYFDQSKGEDFIRFRVDASNNLKDKLENEVDSLKEKRFILDYTKNIYSPRQDAIERIEIVRKKLEPMLGHLVNQGWKAQGIQDNKVVIVETDPAAYIKKVDAFEAFMKNVLGQWTKIFVEEMKIRPEDMWLLSLFVHLTLNSITCHTGEENSIRYTPYW